MTAAVAVTVLLLAACGGNGDESKDSGLQPTYSVGGTVAGLSGSGLVLRNNGADDLRIAANGSFAFATQLPTTTSYDVTVYAQPSNPSQTCVVTAGTGNWLGSAITTVAANCTTNSYTVGGTVSGLKGSGLALRNNDGDDLPVHGNGVFDFPGKVASGDRYDVVVASQPSNPAQICWTTDAGGTVGDNDTATIIVACGSIGRFLYVECNAYNLGPAICAYAIDASTGALSDVPGTPFRLTIAAGIYNFTVTPDSRFAYWNSELENWISGFAIDSVTGALSPIPGGAFPTSGASPQPLAFDPSSRFAYAGSIDGNVSGYVIDAVTGALTPVPGSPFPAGTDPGRAVVDAKGQFLYVPNRGSDSVSAFAINPVSGTLAPVPGSPFASGSKPSFIRFTPDGRLAYVWEFFERDSVSVYSVDSISGALAEVAASPFTGAPPPSSFTANGKFAYSTWGYSFNSRSTVSGFAVNATTGALTPVPGSSYSICCGNAFVSPHPSGKFLYVEGGYTVPGTSRTYGFAIDGATGALEPLAGSPYFCCRRVLSLTFDASGKFGYQLWRDGQPGLYLTPIAMDLVTGVLTALPWLDSRADMRGYSIFAY